jgi:hypothetical protein
LLPLEAGSYISAIDTERMSACGVPSWSSAPSLTTVTPGATHLLSTPAASVAASSLPAAPSPTALIADTL